MRTVQRHVFVSDGTKDHRGQPRCVECKTPKTNARHDLPDTAEAAEIDARRTGERRE